MASGTEEIKHDFKINWFTGKLLSI